jgi:beta-lactamase regulating signal transducer with metallopeptidase domain
MLALALGCVAAPTAMSAPIEGGNAFSELSEKAQQETTPTQTTASTASTETSSGSDSTTLILGVIIAVALVGAIAFVIIRDARRVAPAGDAQLTEATSSRDAAARLRRRRAKAKAARRQRKRNR